MEKSIKKIFRITCPSIELLKQLKDLRIFMEDRLSFLPDPILNIGQFIKMKNENIIENNFWARIILFL